MIDELLDEVQEDENSPIVLASGVCRIFEGLYLRPYLCPGGVPTIGYGTTRYEDGVRVTLTDAPITKNRAEELLMHELRTVCFPSVMRLCPTLEKWGVGAIAAIIDFTYNLGAGNLQSSTLRRRILENNKNAAKHELKRWVIGGGRVLPGLVKRRDAEVALIG
jgi:lysozyme